VQRDPESSSSGTREKILDVAEDLIARDGFENLKLKEMAERLGIRSPSIFAHYAGRDAVVSAVVLRYLHSLDDQFLADGRDDPTGGLMDGIRHLVRQWATHPAYVRLCLRDLEYPHGMPEAHWKLEGSALENALSGPIGAMIARLKAILDRGYELGEFREMDVITVYRQILGAVLVIFTIPSQKLLSADTSRAELEVAIREVEDLILRFVQPA